MESSNISDNYPQDNKPDWRDFVTQAPDYSPKTSTWKTVKKWTLLISAANAVLTFMWYASSFNNGHIFGELLPALLFFINIIATLIILLIGFVVNTVAEGEKGGVSEGEVDSAEESGEQICVLDIGKRKKE